MKFNTICIKFDQKNKNTYILRFFRSFKNLGFFEAIFQPWYKQSSIFILALKDASHIWLTKLSRFDFTLY